MSTPVDACFCPIGAVAGEVIFSPDMVTLPHPDHVTDWRQAVADVDRENQRRREAHQRAVDAEAQRVRDIEATHAEMRRRCPRCGP